MKLDHATQQVVDSLWTSIRVELHHTFVAKDEVIDLMLVCLVAGEHLLIIGPPGTAKTAIVRRLVARVDARCFEYLLTRFTEPNEIFGPVDMALYTSEGRYRRLTSGMLPEANIAFLDEVFKANSAILNALLSVLNERVFFNGDPEGPGIVRETIPLLSVFAASNTIPDDPELAALVDRFPVRVVTDNVPDTAMSRMLRCAWEEERSRMQRDAEEVGLASYITPEDIRSLTQIVPGVDVSAAEEPLLRFVSLARAEGLEISDRGTVRLLRLAAASALLRRSGECRLEDLWVLKHAWRHVSQAPAVERLVRDVAGDVSGSGRAYRPMEEIGRDVEAFEARPVEKLSEAEALAALHSIQILRRELEEHPAEEGDRRPLQDRITASVDRILAVFEGKSQPRV